MLASPDIYSGGAGFTNATGTVGVGEGDGFTTGDAVPLATALSISFPLVRLSLRSCPNATPTQADHQQQADYLRALKSS